MAKIPSPLATEDPEILAITRAKHKQLVALITASPKTDIEASTWLEALIAATLSMVSENLQREHAMFACGMIAGRFQTLANQLQERKEPTEH